MMLRRSILGCPTRAGLASRILGSGSGRPFHAFASIQQNCHGSSGVVENFKAESSILQNMRMKFGFLRMSGNVSSPYALSFSTRAHSGNLDDVDAIKIGEPPRSMDYVQGLLRDTGRNEYPRLPFYDRQAGIGNSPGSMDYVQGLHQENGNDLYPRRPPNDRQFEANADIVHMKLMRNNCFITVTDSKGNKKFGVTAGKLAGKGGKLARYSAEAAAEEIGRKVRQMKTKSVVVKVNGFTFFRKKKQAILSFKDGYTNSRGNMSPVVYIEDTTRKPHNGCRLPKKRRI